MFGTGEQRFSYVLVDLRQMQIGKHDQQKNEYQEHQEQDDIVTVFSE